MPWPKPNPFCFQASLCFFCFYASVAPPPHPNAFLLSFPSQSWLIVSCARKPNVVFPNGSLPPSSEPLWPCVFPSVCPEDLAPEPASLPRSSDSTSAQTCGFSKLSHLCNGNNISSKYRTDWMSPSLKCLAHRKYSLGACSDCYHRVIALHLICRCLEDSRVLMLVLHKISQVLLRWPCIQVCPLSLHRY